VASVVDPDADEDERLAAEDRIEAEIGVSVRATVRAIPAATPAEALEQEAQRTDLIVLGVSGMATASVREAVAGLSAVDDCSLVLVRGHPEAPLEPRKRS
jgi:hypothetical protein